MEVKIHKLSEKAIIPSRATPLSAAMDIHACFHTDNVKINSGQNIYNNSIIEKDGLGTITIYNNGWALVPTGLIFILPPDVKMNIRSRSGNVWKSGIVVMNQPGLVDPDYTKETFVLLKNNGINPYTVKDGDRIAQITFEYIHHPTFSEIGYDEVQDVANKYARIGGFGSTGI